MTENWSGASATGPSFLGPEGVDSLSGPVPNLGHANPQPDFWAGASPYLMGDRFENPTSSVMEDSDLSPTVPLTLVPEPHSYPTPYLHSSGHLLGPPTAARLVQPPPQERGPIQYGVAPAYAAPGHGYGYPPGEHPHATLTLVLGAVGIVVPVLSFVAWYFGGQARTEIRNGAPFAWRGGLVVGYWLGKILSILTIVSVCASVLLGILGFILQVSLFAYILGIF